MDDFLYILRLQLEGRIPEENVKAQIHLYENYINECMAGGEPLERVLRRIGDPAKVADLIVDAYHEKREKEHDKDWGGMLQVLTETGLVPDPEEAQRKTEEDMNSEEYINSILQNPKHGIKAEFSQEKGWNVHLGKFKLNSWYGYLIIMFVIVGLFTLIQQIGKLM